MTLYTKLSIQIMYKILVLLLSLNFSLLADSKKPNILFAFADDWGRHASVYAEMDGPGTVNDVFKTTNFDLIAKSGVLFNNAYVNAPSCTPCSAGGTSAVPHRGS